MEDQFSPLYSNDCIQKYNAVAGNIMYQMRSLKLSMEGYSLENVKSFEELNCELAKYSKKHAAHQWAQKNAGNCSEMYVHAFHCLDHTFNMN